MLDKAPQRPAGRPGGWTANSTELVSTMRVITTDRREGVFCTGVRLPWHLNARESYKTAMPHEILQSY
jgi:hypothetical protein